MAGKYKNTGELGDCDPIIKVKDLWQNQKVSISNRPLSGNDPAIPCGLVAKSVFNDTFEIWSKAVTG